MNENGFATEFFATESRPDDGEEYSHKEDNDGFGGVGGGGGNSDGWSNDEAAAIQDAFYETNNGTDSYRYDYFGLVAFYDLLETGAPFAVTHYNDEIGDAGTEIE